MKIHTRLLIGFILVIFLVLIQALTVNKLQNKLYRNVVLIDNIESPLDIMSEQVIGYDAMLTGQIHVALLHAQKGEYEKSAEHKAKYDEIGIKLDDLLKRDATILLNKSERTQEQKDETSMYLKKLDVVNLKLVDLETRAFEAIEKRDLETAYSLVVVGDYEKYKAELYQDYLSWAEIEQETTSGMHQEVLEESHQIVYLSLGISLGIMVMMIITMVMINSFVSKLIDDVKRGKITD